MDLTYVCFVNRNLVKGEYLSVEMSFTIISVRNNFRNCTGSPVKNRQRLILNSISEKITHCLCVSSSTSGVFWHSLVA